MGLLGFIVFLILTYLATTTTVANLLPKHKPLVTNIIHRNSIFSPTYKKNDTIADRAKSAMQNSIGRFAYLISERGSNIETDLYNDDNHLFSVNFSIGQPPTLQLAKMDTTTSFIWIQCKPCAGKCFDYAGPTFDPSKSLTYANLSCRDPVCEFSHHNMYYNICNRAKHCKYFIKYVNDYGSNYGSTGMFATENFTFNDGYNVVSNVFGCSHHNKNGRRQNWGGIFGLADSPVSLVTKLGNKFSYCIGNIDDPQYMYNKLIIGDLSNFEGDSIPFEVYHTRYYVTLKGIRVGEKLLDINPEVFQRTAKGDGGVIIDSGTEFSFLPEIQYNVLQNEISGMLDGFLPRVYNKPEPWRLCYRGSLSEDLDEFPAVAFVLADGAEFVLDTRNLFNYIDTNVFCLSILSSTQISNSNNLSIIGIMAQLNYNVGYDLNNHRICHNGFPSRLG